MALSTAWPGARAGKPPSRSSPRPAARPRARVSAGFGARGALGLPTSGVTAWWGAGPRRYIQGPLAGLRRPRLLGKAHAKHRRTVAGRARTRAALALAIVRARPRGSLVAGCAARHLPPLPTPSRPLALSSPHRHFGTLSLSRKGEHSKHRRSLGKHEYILGGIGKVQPPRLPRASVECERRGSLVWEAQRLMPAKRERKGRDYRLAMAADHSSRELARARTAGGLRPADAVPRRGRGTDPGGPSGVRGGAGHRRAAAPPPTVDAVLSVRGDRLPAAYCQHRASLTARVPVFRRSTARRRARACGRMSYYHLDREGPRHGRAADTFSDLGLARGPQPPSATRIASCCARMAGAHARLSC